MSRRLRGRRERVRRPDPVKVLFEDRFTQDLAAGAIHGTRSTCGRAIRHVVDTVNALSISGGNLSYTVGTASGDPGIWYKGLDEDKLPLMHRTLFLLEFSNPVAGGKYIGFDQNFAGGLPTNKPNLYSSAGGDFRVNESIAPDPWNLPQIATIAAGYRTLGILGYQEGTFGVQRTVFLEYHDDTQRWEILWVSPNEQRRNAYPTYHMAGALVQETHIRQIGAYVLSAHAVKHLGPVIWDPVTPDAVFETPNDGMFYFRNLTVGAATQSISPRYVDNSNKLSLQVLPDGSLQLRDKVGGVSTDVITAPAATVSSGDSLGLRLEGVNATLWHSGTSAPLGTTAAVGQLTGSYTVGSNPVGAVQEFWPLYTRKIPKLTGV